MSMPSRLLVFLVFTAATGCGRSETSERILLVTIDTLRWDHLGYMGHDVATPNLDRLAASGTVFTQAVTAAPITLPAHASILSGLYPPRHRARNNGSFRVPDDVETVAEALKRAGFATAAFVGAFVLDRRFGLEQGFDHYDDELPEENPLHSIYYAERPAEEVVERALAWIRSHEDEPFFAWVHVYDPHAPLKAPPPYAERYPDRPYEAEIAYTDAALGPLLDAVSDIDGTVIVTADHGEGLGEHGESSHTLFVYDSTMRVPLVMKGRGIPEGERRDDQVRSVDIAPTILELAGVTPEDELDGVSLLPVVSSTEAPSLAAYGESFAPRFDFNWSELRFLRKDGFKLIDAPRPELYHLTTDPGELTNLWSEPPPDAGRRLYRELEAFKKTADTGPIVPSVDVDEDTARRLESLGYVGTAAASSLEDRERPDPKDRVEIFERLSQLGPELSDEEIIAICRDVLAMEPSNLLARTRLANKLSEQKRFEEAVVEYQELMRVSEIGTKGMENLAVALLLLDRTEEALAITERAVAEAPWYLELQVLRGEALEKAGRLEEALQAYAKTVELRPEDPETYWRRGTIAVKLGDDAQAERDFRQALEQDASFVEGRAALARLLTRTGRREEAFDVLSSGNPDSAEIKTARAEAYLASRQLDEARSLLEEARTEAPDNTRVLALLGSLYGQSGELRKAERLLERAIALGESDAEVRRNLALVYLRQGKTDAAIAELRSAGEDAPGDASVWYTLGNTYLRARQARHAVSAFERAVDLRPEWPEALFNLGIAYEQVGASGEAAEAYRRFLASRGAADPERRAEAERRLDALR